MTYDTMRKVALEIVQLERDVPEEKWFDDAENYAVSLIRRLVEEAYDHGRKADPVAEWSLSEVPKRAV